MKSKENMMFGWMGKIIKIDISNGKQEEVEISDELRRKYLGGRGLGVKLYSDMCSTDIDPLSPENPLIFLTGPLTGLIPTAGRFQVVSRSPQTGTICDSSSGGFFGNQLKRTGLDGFIITGKAEKPVYLLITDDGIEIKDATYLWGKNTHETREVLLEEYSSRASIASIGPAGENQVLFSAIMNDKDRAAGRGGMGAIMGSKNLKAIAVRGTQRPALADKGAFKALVRQGAKDFPDSMIAEMGKYGTSGGVAANQASGGLPSYNYNRCVVDDWKKISGN